MNVPQLDVRAFELAGKTYQVRKINVFDQLTLVSKLSLILATIGEQKDKTLILQNFAKFFAAFAANMTKDDLEEIFKLSLTSIFRKVKTTWQPVFKNGQMLFQDIDLKDTLALVWKVVEVNNLADFFTIPDSNPAGNQEN
jgi:DTW domain-containing protein YfiP